MTISFWQQRSLAAERTYDVAVVGGGIIGCATAFWLRRLRPSLRVAILDRGRLAAGASGRNAGFLIQGTAQDYMTDRARYGADHARRLWHFTRENRDLIGSELRAQRIGLEATGSLTVAGSADEDARLQEAVSPMRSDGAPVAYIPPEATNARLMSQGFLGSLYVPSGATVDPVRLVQNVAEESGAELLEHHHVRALHPAGVGVRLETDVRTVYAGQVVLALGAYLPRLVPSLSAYVRPVRAQMLATEPAVQRWLQVPSYTHEGYFYLRQLRDGTILLGGARHLHVRDEVGYEDATTSSLQEDLLAYLHRHFPQSRGLVVTQRWSGTMGFSMDGLPVVGTMPGIGGSVWATGFTGHGMGYGLRFGLLLAETVLDYPRPEDADLFAAGRFEEPVRAAQAG